MTVNTRQIELLIVILTAVFSAYFTLDAIYAKQKELQAAQEQILETKKEIIRMGLEVSHDATSASLKQDAAAAVYYRQIDRDPDLELTGPEQSRKEFVEEQVQAKQHKIHMIEMRQLQLEGSE